MKLIQTFALAVLVLGGASLLLMLFMQAHLPASEHFEWKTTCRSEDPCHCHYKEQDCLCHRGTKLGESCEQTLCDWHGDRAQLMCDTCNAEHCHGCSSENSCKSSNVDSSDPPSCRWVNGDLTDPAPHCEAVCSPYHCEGCRKDRAMCGKYPEECMFSDSLDMCVPKCGHNACAGCDGQSECAGAPGCLWDKPQCLGAFKHVLSVLDCTPVCTRDCSASVVDEEGGRGCWTCGTPSTCLNAPKAANCKWDSDTAMCNGGNADSIGVVYGDIVNAYRSDLPMRFDSLLGNIVIEHHETIQDRVWRFDDLTTVVGDIILSHNEHLDSLNLNQLLLLDGDLRLFDNPVLSELRFHPDFKMTGCVQIERSPKVLRFLAKTLHTSLMGLRLCDDKHSSESTFMETDN